MKLQTSVAAILALLALLSCKGQHNRAGEAQAPAQTNASVENSVSAESIASTLPTEPSNADFVVFDGMNLHNKPAEIRAAGLVPFKLISAKRLFGKTNPELRSENSMVLPKKAVVSRIARRIERNGYQVAVFDIEHWPLKGDDYRQSLDNYLTVLEWIQEAAPGVEWGYYGQVPIRNHGSAVQPESSRRYRRWLEKNLRLTPLASGVDALFPSLYTKNDNRERWVRSAERHIAMARRLNPDAPVYVYLWPLYHDGTNEPIDPEFWKLQLETAHTHADGAVVRMGVSYEWDPEAPWWQETKEFMQELRD